MATVRRAMVNWEGDLATGSGHVDAATSGAFSKLPVTWASRTETANGRTSPEELLAAAHASCFSMAFSSELAKAGSPPASLNVQAEIAADRVDGKLTVISSKLTVHGRAAGLDEGQFRALAEKAKDGCPISRALQGNVELSVEASLDR